MKIVANIKIELEVSEEVFENYKREDMDAMSILTGDDSKITITDITIDDDIMDEEIDITEQIKEAILEVKKA